MSDTTPVELMDRATMSIDELGLAFGYVTDAFDALAPKIYNLIEQLRYAQERIKELEAQEEQ